MCRSKCDWRISFQISLARKTWQWKQQQTEYFCIHSIPVNSARLFVGYTRQLHSTWKWNATFSVPRGKEGSTAVKLCGATAVPLIGLHLISVKPPWIGVTFLQLPLIKWPAYFITDSLHTNNAMCWRESFCDSLILKGREHPQQLQSDKDWFDVFSGRPVSFPHELLRTQKLGSPLLRIQSYQRSSLFEIQRRLTCLLRLLPGTRGVRWT